MFNSVKLLKYIYSLKKNIKKLKGYTFIAIFFFLSILMWFLWQNWCFDVVHFLPKYLRIQKKYLGMDLAAKLSRLVYKK